MIKKVLLISTVFPYPKDNGKKIILSSILQYFIDTVGEENTYYMVLGDEEEQTHSPYPNLRIYNLSNPTTANKIFNIIKYSLIMKKKSIQEAIIFNNDIQGKVKDFINENNIDLVLYDTIRVSQMFEDANFNVEQYVYMDDLFSVRYEKMLEAMAAYKDLNFDSLGNFKKFIPRFAHKFVHLKMLNRYLLKIESRLIYRREIDTANTFQNTLLISHKEIDELKKRSSSESIKLVRPCLQSGNLDFKRTYDGSPTFLFLGSLNLPHNDVAICSFIKQVMDSPRIEISNVRLKIIGKYPSKELLELEKKYPDNIQLLGFVENLEEIFKSACAMIIPLLFGSGVKIKTLEALSYGLPIITTDYGIEGIDVTEDICLIENNISNYPFLMKKLINLELNKYYSANAVNFFEENYSKEAVSNLYDNLFSIPQKLNKDNSFR